MTEPAWFRYERNNGRWRPVVYHGARPGIPKGEEDRFSTLWPVPQDCLTEDGSPMFGKLQARFPVPKDGA